MDLSGSHVASLVRPRVAVAVITATAALTIGVSLYFSHRQHENVDGAPDGHGSTATGGGLHRRNAVRRPRRPSQANAVNGTGRAAGAPGGDDNDNDNNNNNNSAAGGNTTDENAGIEASRDDRVADERWLDDMAQAAVQRAGQNIVSLLFRVSEDNARRSAYVHRGCACNACGIVPIRGIRYRCANCADFDLCETCESQGLHIKTHIFYKVKVPAPPFGPRQMQPVWYPGDPDSCLRSLPRSLMARLSRETGFERQELEAFWEQWTYMANTEWRDDPDELGLAMDRKTFERCLVPSGGYRHAAPNLIHERMFAFYDTNNDDLIGFSEFLHGLSYRKRKDKLRKIFDGYDTDRDGLVNRRDFLRFFRAYYVLYKQMHKDILEGLDDQVMSSIETHQLVSNRQPLSSLFGREGRVPQADLQLMLFGKAVNNTTGDVTVIDGVSGVVTEDKPDTASREDILSRLFTRSELRPHGALFDSQPSTAGSGHGQHGSTAMGRGGDDDDHNTNNNNENRGDVNVDDDRYAREDGGAEVRYWEALLNPPMSVQDLPPLLVGRRNSSSFLDDGIFVATEDEGLGDAGDLPWPDEGERGERAQQNENEPPTTAADAGPGTAGDGGSVANASNAATASDVHSAGSSALASLDNQQSNPPVSGANGRPRASNQRPPTAGQLRAQQEAIMRTQKSRKAKVAARRKLHERWKRRRFYLDEEEGAAPPENWKDDEDVLAQHEVVAQGAESTQAEPSQRRSRSSSKVRFAEDTEDFETRSNPSTSSRSVPERWGGMEIPDAEKDAGREILYQVMQQAFNELLDILFLEKENLAVAAAETRDVRDKYRHLLDALDAEDTTDDKGTASWASWAPVVSTTTPTAAKPLGERTLEELLAQSGYTIVESPDEELEEKEGENNGGANEEATDDGEVVHDDDRAAVQHEEDDGHDTEFGKDEAAVGQDATAVQRQQPTSASGPSIRVDTTRADEQPERGSPTQHHLPAFSRAVKAQERDPTMPQFRPDADDDRSAATVADGRPDAVPADGSEPTETRAQAFSLAAASTTATVATSSEGHTSPPGTLTPPVFDAASANGAVAASSSAAALSSSSTSSSQDGSTKENERQPTRQRNAKKAQTAHPFGAARNKSKNKSKSKDGSGSGSSGAGTPVPIPRSTLLGWKRLDKAEQEAKTRGGWGKLSFQEFELIFVQEEGASNRLDYLGSWIDFCIP
ncbi:EF hand domain-containing protein [Niveomyces insectorum RCEF 264]|uniref:EF hand domain-containing protein n=1 Tax=Niveomyces insectorum RCEF 264 TaxID=1081102 RepID=A0A167VNK0_9HYPO|nr:EF hand domain-containing protein [Niveomyces insectorum RCEF 264]